MENDRQLETGEKDVNANTEQRCAGSIRKRRKSRWSSVDDSHLRPPISLGSANNIAGNQMINSSGNPAINSQVNINVRRNTVATIQSINVEQITQTMIPKAIDRIFRTAQRISQEMLIVDDLQQFLTEHKFNLEVRPFGSATYGFGGAGTDFNICLLNKDGDKSQTGVNTLFESFVKAFEEKSGFTVLDRIAPRGMKNRLTVINAFGIPCTLQIDTDANRIESSQIIRDCLLHSPICHHLIAFIRAWQDSLIEAAKQNGTPAFQFNTYIIAVLVIFFYQIDQKFPKIGNVPSTPSKSIANVPPVNVNKLKRAVRQFFQFYGKIYGLYYKIVSINIGRSEDWKYDKRSQLTPEQKSLRDGIKSNASDWRNSSMLVQDIKSPSTNIAVDVSESETKNFQQLCRMFESAKLVDKAVDEYLLKVHQTRPARVVDLTDDMDSDRPPPAKRIAREPGASNTTISNSNASSVSDITPISETVQIITKLVTDNKKMIFQDMPATAVEFVSRTALRLSDEQDILQFLKRHLSANSIELQPMPFGSATYGFGGPETDFNILLVHSNGTKVELKQTFRSLGNLFDAPAFQKYFELLAKLNGNRAIGKRFKLQHKATDIICWVHLSFNNDMAESSQILRNCILHAPICYHLIAYLKAWQEALNRVAILKEMHAFEFNSYIISVLVIFYLQLNQNFPKLAKVPASQATSIDNLPSVDVHLLKQSIRQFFEFYGNFYEIKERVISVNVGQWEERAFRRDQENEYTPEQKRLRDGMSTEFRNWGNCSMFVEDLNAVGKNITAEIPEDHAVHFVAMCKLFSVIDSPEHDQAIDEYLMKLILVRSPIASNGSATASASTGLPMPMRITNNNLDEMAGSSARNLQRVDPRLSEKQPEIPRLPSLMESRDGFEYEIFTIVVQFIHDLDPTMKLFPFGSTQYGIKYPNANYNLLVTTGASRPDQVSQWFIFRSEQSNLNCHFKGLQQVKGNRVMSSQISMIHIKSGIQCFIAFDPDDTIAKSAEIISQFAADPLCNYLIRSVRSCIQKSGCHQFNTYIISILVIFFLQLKHHYPIVRQCLAVTSTDSDYKPVLRQFFMFYLNNYSMSSQIISANIGQWQQLLTSQIQKSNPDKLRLYMAIERFPENWRGCVMYVQDLVRPFINAAAEIPSEAAENFKKICRKFI